MNRLIVGGNMQSISILKKFYMEKGAHELENGYEGQSKNTFSEEELFYLSKYKKLFTISGGNVLDFSKVSSTDYYDGTGFFNTIRVIAKGYELNIKDVMESLRLLGINQENNYIIFDTDEYLAKFSNSKVNSSTVIVDNKLVATIFYYESLFGKELEVIPTIIEYNIDNIEEINNSVELKSEFKAMLASEMENYLSDDSTLENSYLLIERFLLEIEMHIRASRFLLAYRSLLRASQEADAIKVKTGVNSEKYIDYMNRINELYKEIREELFRRNHE